MEDNDASFWRQLIPDISTRMSHSYLKDNMPKSSLCPPIFYS